MNFKIIILFAFLLFSESLFSQVCCNTTIPCSMNGATVGIYETTGNGFPSTNSLGQSCEALVFGGSNPSSNFLTYCAVPVSLLSENPGCFAATVTVKAPECPNYPKTYDWAPQNNGAIFTFPIPIGGTIEIDFVYYRTCVFDCDPQFPGETRAYYYEATIVEFIHPSKQTYTLDAPGGAYFDGSLSCD